MSDEQLTKAKKAIGAAQRKAKKIAADQAIPRATRARNALKVKAEALDQVGELLAGKA